MYRLKRAVDIEALLRNMPSQEMEPSSRTSLINIVNKVARYREIAHYLYRLSIKSTLLQKMELTTICLPEEAYNRPPADPATPTLGMVLTRGTQPRRKAEVSRIRRLIDITYPNINQEFASQVTKTLTISKVHAEIQLIHHLEMNPSRLPPRVIASSKDAYFLCDAFIFMHGKMYTARTHGRLYPWMASSSCTCLCQST